MSDAAQTAAWISGVQRGDGSIPWYVDGPVEPWDHVEAAIGLVLGARDRDAARALDWWAGAQRPDGSLPARRVRGRLVDGTGESHAAVHAAVALRVWQLRTAEPTVATRWWPAVERGVGYTLDLMLRSGAVRWARDDRGAAWPTALPTSAASVLLGLRSAVAVGHALGIERPGWTRAADRLAVTLAGPHPDVDPPGRHAMDWYWPVLAGAEGPGRIERGWGRFVEPGRGVRCVVDRPWVTTAETAELALACAALGQRERAATLLADVGHLREPDGSWWTGWVWPDAARWPVERTTWTAAAVLLAADALDPASAVSRLLGEARPAQQPQAVGAAGVLERP